MHSSFIKSSLSLIILLFLMTAYFGWLDRVAQQQTQKGLNRALLSYGLARGLNGVISVAQGTELAFEPIGVGMTFTPGQILDPVNDLVERFSWLVLASGGALGVQNILLLISSWSGFSFFLLAVSMLVIVLIWKPHLFSESIRIKITKILAILIILRFAIPMVAIVNELIYTQFLQPQYIEAKINIQSTVNSIQTPENNNPIVESDPGIIEQVKNVYHSANDALDIKSQLDKLKTSMSELTKDALNMMVVFVVQTLLLPLVFLWLILQLIKYVIQCRWIKL